MICPACGKEIKDGNVLCEGCGNEIQIVPDFEAEIEITMEDSISGLVENAFNDSQKLPEPDDSQGDMGDTIDLSDKWELVKTKDLSQIIEEDAQAKREQELEKQRKRKVRWRLILPVIAGVVLLAVLAIYIFVAIQKYKENTPEAYLKKAEEAVLAGNASEGADYYQLVLERDSTDMEARKGLASCYLQMGETELAKENYLILVQDAPDPECYEKLIGIYEQQQDFEAINSLIRECTDESILAAFSGYLADAPAFSEPEGTYNESLVLKLMSDKPGDIYYTLDGSEPDTSSLHYETPITLEDGKNVVRAIFVNEKGVLSESITGVYEVHAPLPQLPVVSPKDGDFNSAGYITANSEEGYSVYYTDDGTMPDENAILYEYPILIPLGDSTFKFICVDQNNRRSDILSRTYHLEISSVCTEAEAVNYVLTALTATGQMLDVSGLSLAGDGIYQYECTGVVPGQGSDCYLLKEFFQKTGSDDHKETGKYYAVDTTLGTLYRASKNESGRYDLSPFGQ